jgi:hypothetical protein
LTLNRSSAGPDESPEQVSAKHAPDLMIGSLTGKYHDTNITTGPMAKLIRMTGPMAKLNIKKQLIKMCLLSKWTESPIFEKLAGNSKIASNTIADVKRQNSFADVKRKICEMRPTCEHGKLDHRTHSKLLKWLKRKKNNG